MGIFHNNNVFTVFKKKKNYWPQTWTVVCIMRECQSSTSEILALLFFVMLIVSSRI